MATNVYIRGLSRRGFRVKSVGGTIKTVKFVKDATAVNNVQVDIDDPATQQVLSRERDNFIRVASATANTTSIIGLDRRGFRLTSGGTTSKVKVGNVAVTTVDLGDYRVARVLRREKRDWLRSTSVSSVAIRGLTEAQASFNLSREAAATAVLNSTGTAPADGATVTINDRTYTWKTALTPTAGQVLIGVSSDTALDNLVAAVNGAAGSGTTYAAGTLKPTGVTAGARAGTGATGTVTFTAAVTGSTGNTFASTETSAQNAFTNGATFTGGSSVDKVRKSATVTVDPRLAKNYQQLRRHYRSWVESA